MSKKKPGPVRVRLENCRRAWRHIHNQNMRLAAMNSRITAPAPPTLSGMPRGSNGDKMAGDIANKVELEEKISRLEAEAKAEMAELEQLFHVLVNPDEQLVLEMRYFDCWEWEAIIAALYAAKEDYDDSFEKYQRQAYRIHGNALQRLEMAHTKAGYKKK